MEAAGTPAVPRGGRYDPLRRRSGSSASAAGGAGARSASIACRQRANASVPGVCPRAVQAAASSRACWNDNPQPANAASNPAAITFAPTDIVRADGGRKTGIAFMLHLTMSFVCWPTAHRTQSNLPGAVIECAGPE